jgi:hypothetical protein
LHLRPCWIFKLPQALYWRSWNCRFHSFLSFWSVQHFVLSVQAFLFQCVCIPYTEWMKCNCCIVSSEGISKSHIAALPGFDILNLHVSFRLADWLWASTNGLFLWWYSELDLNLVPR